MPQVDAETKALQDAIYLSKVARARRTPMSEKLATGAHLFDEGMQQMRAAIRSDNPSFTAEQVEREVTRRLKIRKLLDEGNLYRDAGVLDE
jgi:hypothetical protein